MEDRNYRLIVAYFDKTIDDDGLAELKEWLEGNSHNQEMFSETIHILSVSKSAFMQPDRSVTSWARIHAHIAAEEPVLQLKQEGPAEMNKLKPVITKFYANRWFVAAMFLMMISTAALIGYQFPFMQMATRPAYTKISNPKGKHSTIVLPDSSVIHLGAGSTIRYQQSFTAAKRLIELDGEAFFEVRHQVHRPFIVKSGRISTVVLGTTFNVKAFAVKNTVSITVSTGKVGIISNLKGKPELVSFLLPDEQLEINTQTGSFISSKANAAAVSGWTENNFVYYNTSLKDIAESLERHYNIKIEFSNPELAKIKLTAKFNNLPLGEITSSLSALSGLSFNKNGNEITVANHHQKRRANMK